ncbi:MAG: pirin family protein [Acidimicrobiales bacterium]
MAIEVRKAHSRGETNIGWLDSRHSFSFGSYVDQSNTGHGLLLVSNDDRVAPTTGFGMHGHSDMEIITWVLSGEIEHADTLGNHGIIAPGLAQRMTAGTGIRHSEHNPSPDIEAHFVQMWVPPDTPGLEPSYEQVEVGELIEKGGLVPIAGGPASGAAIEINQRDAVMYVGRLRSGELVATPTAAHVHVFVAVGAVHFNGAELLDAGDAVRLTEEGPHSLQAGSDGAEVIVWATA